MKKTAVFISIGVTLSALILLSLPKNINVTLSVSPQSVFIGDKIELKIRTFCPKGITAEFPDMTQALKDFEIKEIKTSANTYNAILQNFSPKKYTVPEFKIKFKDKTGKIIKELETKKIEVVVKSVVSKNKESADIRDIKPPMGPSYGGILYFLASIILIAFAIFILLKYRKKKQEAEILAAIKPPHVIALERIRELRKKDLVSRGLIKEFYFQLSLIVRHYLEDRFNLRAPEMTTEEFLLRLKNSNDLTEEHKKLLSDFLAHSDMVKFAKYTPSEDEIEKSLNYAIQLIEQTKNDV